MLSIWFKNLWLHWCAWNQTNALERVVKTRSEETQWRGLEGVVLLHTHLLYCFPKPCLQTLQTPRSRDSCPLLVCVGRECERVVYPGADTKPPQFWRWNHTEDVWSDLNHRRWITNRLLFLLNNVSFFLWINYHAEWTPQLRNLAGSLGRCTFFVVVVVVDCTLTAREADSTLICFLSSLHERKWSFGVERYCTRVGVLVSRDILLWNIKSIKSLARYWAAEIRISVAVKDSGVILEAWPGVSFFFFPLSLSLSL